MKEWHFNDPIYCYKIEKPGYSQKEKMNELIQKS